jgi:SAM-dependent methyltransferase
MIESLRTSIVMSRPLYRRMRHAFANFGLRGAVNKAIHRLGPALSQQLRNRVGADSGSAAPDRANVIHPFDLAYGVDTSGLIWGEDLPTPRANAFWSSAYYGIAPSIFNQLLRELEARLAPDWSSFTFIDLGCGKGRALMLASRLPFHAILGVEISPELARIAQQNLTVFSAPWQQCCSLEAHESDASCFDLPLTPLFIYLYHPFAKPVLEVFLRNLERSLQHCPRDAWLLYFNPELEQVLTNHPAFNQQFHASFAMQVEDASADRFHNKEEAVAVYRYVPAHCKGTFKGAGKSSGLASD